MNSVIASLPGDEVMSDRSEDQDEEEEEVEGEEQWRRKRKMKKKNLVMLGCGHSTTQLRLYYILRLRPCRRPPWLKGTAGWLTAEMCNCL